MTVVFDIDHEAGNFSEYAASVTDGGRLSIAAAAALAATNYGMSVYVNSQTLIYAYQVLGSPSTSGVARVRAYIDPNGVDIPPDATTSFIYLVNSSGTQTICSFQLGRNSEDTAYFLRGVIALDGGGVVHCQNAEITDAPHYMELEVNRSTGPSTNNGSLEFYLDGVLQETITGQDNYDRFANLYMVIAGFAAPTANILGTYYVDQIVVNDDGSTIGPVSSSTTISVSDAGAGVDALNNLAVSFSLADAGSGADTLPGPTASLSLTDLVTGSDVLAQLLASLGVIDNGSAADLIANLAAGLGLADAASGVDAPSINAAFSLADNGSAVEVHGIVAGLTVNDSAAGADAPAVLVTLTLTDAGSGADAAVLFIEVLKSVADLAAGNENFGISVSGTVNDTGQGGDNLSLSVSLGVTDNGSGAELVSILKYMFLLITDLAGGVESLNVSVGAAVTDTGHGSDGPALNVAFVIADTASAVESFSILQAVFVMVSDLAQSSDTVSSVSVSVPLSDTGQGVELAQIAAALMLFDFGQGIEAVLHFDPVVKIVHVVFTILRRAVAFSLAQYSTAFTLSQRAVDFALNQ